MEEQDIIAKQNMMKNQQAFSNELFNKIDFKVVKPQDGNNVDFNKKRKNHYKNEFGKAKKEIEEDKF